MAFPGWFQPNSTFSVRSDEAICSFDRFLFLSFFLCWKIHDVKRWLKQKIHFENLVISSLRQNSLFFKITQNEASNCMLIDAFLDWRMGVPGFAAFNKPDLLIRGRFGQFWSLLDELVHLYFKLILTQPDEAVYWKSMTSDLLTTLFILDWRRARRTSYDLKKKKKFTGRLAFISLPLLQNRWMNLICSKWDTVEEQNS